MPADESNVLAARGIKIRNTAVVSRGCDVAKPHIHSLITLRDPNAVVQSAKVCDSRVEQSSAAVSAIPSPELADDGE